MKASEMYKITDSMWNEIDQWAEGHDVNLQFRWKFTSIFTALDVLDINSKGVISFIDDEVSNKVNIPDNQHSKIITLNVLPVTDALVDELSFEVHCYEEKKDEVVEEVNKLEKLFSHGKKVEPSWIQNKLSSLSSVAEVNTLPEGQYEVVKLRKTEKKVDD